jgi:hypothetical protein
MISDAKSDNINQMIAITDDFNLVVVVVNETLKCDNIKRLNMFVF